MSTSMASQVAVPHRLPPQRSARGRRGVTGVVAGVLAALLLLAAGAAYLLTRSPMWSAQGSMLVLPRTTTTDPNTVASLYDTLSQGEVPATYAELLRSRQRPGDGVSVEQVPQTMVIQVTAQRGSAAAAESVAGQAIGSGRNYLSKLATPYDVSVVADPRGTAARVGAGRSTLAAVVIFAALVAGLAVQQLVAQVGRLRRTARAS